MIDLGFSGWMADFGEWYPGRGSVHTRRESPEWGTILLHNSNPVLWQQVHRMALDSADAPADLLFFSRSGYVGAGTHASAYWAGDQMTSYGAHDGLASAVKALISSGMSGIAINHSDIGGYTNVSNALLHINRDAELLQRWAEFAAFTPIFRTHEGLKPAENVQPWDDTPAQAAFIQMAKVHGVLRDYLHALNVEATEKGWPMIRHLWLHYPDDPEVLDLEYEYLLGRDILVIPSLAPYRNKRHNGDHVQAYFPAGSWQHLLVPGVTVTGLQKLEVASPLGQPAVYIRADSPWRDRLVQGMAAVYRGPGK
jgi:sulfoquinovosidase